MMPNKSARTDVEAFNVGDMFALSCLFIFWQRDRHDPIRRAADLLVRFPFNRALYYEL
jgi:hypothetical protein